MLSSFHSNMTFFPLVSVRREPFFTFLMRLRKLFQTRMTSSVACSGKVNNKLRILMPEVNEKNRFKVTLLGGPSTGKTAFVGGIEHKAFPTTYVKTIGAAFSAVTVGYDRDLFKFHVWDTAGDPRFFSMIRLYMKDARAVLIFFDSSNPNLDDVVRFYEEAEVQAPDAAVVLVGTKTDLGVNTERTAPVEAWARQKALPVEYCSTLTNTNTFEIFGIILRKVLVPEEQRPEPDDDPVPVEPTPVEPGPKKCSVV